MSGINRIAGVRTCLLSGAAALSLAVTSAHAGAFYIQEHSIKGMGRAYSGEVADTGAESLFWNPAAIAGMSDREVYNGLAGIDVTGNVTDTGTTLQRPLIPTTIPAGQLVSGLTGGLLGLPLPTVANLPGITLPSLPGVKLPNALGLLPAQPVGGPNGKNPIPKALVPSFAAAIPLTDKLTLGINTAAPFNAITSYKGESFVRYDAEKSRFLNINLQGTVAYQVMRSLNVGVGATVDYFDATLTQAAPDLIAPFPDGKIEVRGQDVKFGWIAGAQFKPTHKISIGASYRAAVKHKLDGDLYITGFQGPFALVTSQQSAKTSFTLPWIATVGGRWNVIRPLTLNAQVQRFGWSKFNAVTVDLLGSGQLLPGLLLPKSIVLQQQYKDTTSVAVGADFRVNRYLTTRAGVQYDPTPTNDNYRDARVPDGDRMIYSLGGTLRPTSHMSLDAAVEYIALKKSTLHDDITLYDGTLVPQQLDLRGTSEGHGLAVGVGARLTF